MVGNDFKINVAIDGPAGAGKSTVARLVADELGYTYIDTGSMYRAVTWKVLQNGIAPDDAAAVAAVAQAVEIELQPGASGQRVKVDGKDVTDYIRSSEVTRNVSTVSQNVKLRQLMVQAQQRIAAKKGVVMDGRDIGTAVLPDAEVKVFLTASSQIRAERRHKELQGTGPSVTLERLIEEINLRDRMDGEREVSPLRQAEDAVLLDSTRMTIADVVNGIVDLCRKKRNGEK